LADLVLIGTHPLSRADYETVAYDGRLVALADSAPIDGYRAELERQLANGALIYSVNTGSGADAGRARPRETIELAERNAVRSHAVGVGTCASVPIVRGTMLLQAQAYAQGPPALSHQIVERLLAMLNGRIHPVVPTQGSVSASDLIPNAHIALAVVGEGPVSVDGRSIAAEEAGLDRLALAPKDGGIVNNNAFTTALAFDAVRAAERLVSSADAVVAMTLQAVRGYPEAFDEALIALRPHPGAVATAAHLRSLLTDSELLRAPGRPHDPFSLRCVPQVHGAVRDAIAFAADAVNIELRSVTDNPVVFADTGRVLSGGNFHGAPIGLPLDLLAIAVAQVASLSRRRIHHLIHPLSARDVPPKLTPNGSTSYGMLMLDSLAAALSAECDANARAVSAGAPAIDAMEDHTSMAALAARRASDAITLARQVVAVELACAAQALDLVGRDRAARAARELHASVRTRLPFLAEDGPIDVQPLMELL
jgi:histidine ammonia-lyase